MGKTAVPQLVESEYVGLFTLATEISGCWRKNTILSHDVLPLSFWCLHVFFVLLL